MPGRLAPTAREAATDGSMMFYVRAQQPRQEWRRSGMRCGGDGDAALSESPAGHDGGERNDLVKARSREANDPEDDHRKMNMARIRTFLETRLKNIGAGNCPVAADVAGLLASFDASLSIAASEEESHGLSSVQLAECI